MSPRAIALLLVLGFAARAGAQSLADVAKKEEERRKKTAEPTKVYTNKDLGDLPPTSAAPAKAAEPAKGAEAAKDDKAGKDAKDDKDAKDKDAPKDKAYWAGRVKALHDQLERDTTFADALQSKINALTTDFVNRDDPAQRGVIERDRQKAIAQQAKLKQAVIDDKKAIADLEEEARRAGVPPGWLR